MTESTFTSSTWVNLPITAAAQTWFTPPGGGFFPATAITTEAQAQTKWRGACTARLPNVRVQANSSATLALTLRNAGADTAVTLSIASGTTGTFYDPTVSAAIADGDLVDFKHVFSASGTISFSWGCQFDFASGRPSRMLSGADTGHYNSSIGSAQYCTFGDPQGTTSTESTTKAAAAEACTLSNFQLYCKTNAASNTSIYKTRKNGVDGGGSVSFTSATTGLIEDASGTDSLAAGDTFSFYNSTLPVTGALAFTMSSAKIIGSTINRSQLVGGHMRAATGSTNGHVPMGAYGADLAGDGVSRNVGTPPGVWSMMTYYVGVNPSTAGITVTSRINGVNGNQTLSVTAATTGQFQDSTHSDVVPPRAHLSMTCATATTNPIQNMNVTSLFLNQPTPFMPRAITRPILRR